MVVVAQRLNHSRPASTSRLTAEEFGHESAVRRLIRCRGHDEQLRARSHPLKGEVEPGDDCLGRQEMEHLRAVDRIERFRRKRESVRKPTGHRCEPRVQGTRGSRSQFVKVMYVEIAGDDRGSCLQRGNRGHAVRGTDVEYRIGCISGGSYECCADLVEDVRGPTHTIRGCETTATQQRAEPANRSIELPQRNSLI